MFELSCRHHCPLAPSAVQQCQLFNVVRMKILLKRSKCQDVNFKMFVTFPSRAVYSLSFHANNRVFNNLQCKLWVKCIMHHTSGTNSQKTQSFKAQDFCLPLPFIKLNWELFIHNLHCSCTEFVIFCLIFIILCYLFVFYFILLFKNII